VRLESVVCFRPISLRIGKCLVDKVRVFIWYQSDLIALRWNLFLWVRAIVKFFISYEIHRYPPFLFCEVSIRPICSWWQGGIFSRPLSMKIAQALSLINSVAQSSWILKGSLYNFRNIQSLLTSRSEVFVAIRINKSSFSLIDLLFLFIIFDLLLLFGGIINFSKV
jgi:hypothetical protein